MAILGIEFRSGIEDAWSDIATFVPKLVGFLAVLIIGYIVAKMVAKVLDRLIDRSGFDKLLERGGIKQFFARSDMDAGDVVSKLVFYALVLIVLRMAFGVFGENPVSDMLAGVVSYLPRALAAVLIVVIAAAIASAVRDMITASLGDLGYTKAVANGAAIAIVTFGAFAALNQLRIAPEIVNGLFYALLAVVAGSAIVAIGGGGIAPMQQRWRQVLARYDEEKPRVRREMQHARERAGDGNGHQAMEPHHTNGGASAARAGG